ncbi:MAG TPA: hypothetical protein VG326_01535 [Tepidisphaeraceae bacterium]|jgi:hypothetical protein|nr:hypothetical protein [Tepidisphaeraceae bacterium]
MPLSIRRLLASVALLAGAASLSFAAPAPVSVDLTGLHAIQKFGLDEKIDDHVYGFVDGVADGKAFEENIPADGKPLEAGPKKPAITEKTAQTLWKGDLNDGEFAVVTVLFFQGEGKDAAAVKKFRDDLLAAEKKTPELAKKTLTVEEFKALCGDIVKKQFAVGTLVKNEQAVVSKVKETFARGKTADHYGGLFNVIVWNDGTTVRKRVVPVGLTFGEQYGNDVKIYTKLKFTRNNVFLKDEKGEWSTDQLAPLSDDEKTIHVKMLETELIPGKDGNPIRKTTDYLADIQVKNNGQPTKWKLESEITGVDDIHTYWEYAD